MIEVFTLQEEKILYCRVTEARRGEGGGLRGINILLI